LQKRTKVLLVTKDKRAAAELSMNLVQMGFSIVGLIEPMAFEEAAWQELMPELILLDRESSASSKTEMLLKEKNISLVYLVHSSYVSQTEPSSIPSLIAPFSKEQINSVVGKISFSPKANPILSEQATAISKEIPQLEDRIFVRHKDKMIKLEIEQILYIEADRNYSHIFTKEKKYVLTTTLKKLETKLPDSDFFRIHRSYIINLRQIDEVAETHLVIATKALPISKTLRSALMKRLQTI